MFPFNQYFHTSPNPWFHVTTSCALHFQCVFSTAQWTMVWYSSTSTVFGMLLVPSTGLQRFQMKFVNSWDKGESTKLFYFLLLLMCIVCVCVCVCVYACMCVRDVYKWGYRSEQVEIHMWMSENSIVLVRIIFYLLL